MTDIHQPHDRLFRAVFSDASEAAGLLQTALPATVRNSFDRTALTLLGGTFVDEDLQGSQSDCSTRSSTPRPGSPCRCIYCLSTSRRLTRGCACGSCGTVAESGRPTGAMIRTVASGARSCRWCFTRERAIGAIRPSSATCFPRPRGPCRGYPGSLTSSWTRRLSIPTRLAAASGAATWTWRCR